MLWQRKCWSMHVDSLRWCHRGNGGLMQVDALLLTRRGGVIVVMVVQCGSMHIDASLLTRHRGNGGESEGSWVPVDCHSTN